eukprot:6028483-Amphidinium_carterae.2
MLHGAKRKGTIRSGVTMLQEVQLQFVARLPINAATITVLPVANGTCACTTKGQDPQKHPPKINNQ